MYQAPKYIVEIEQSALQQLEITTKDIQGHPLDIWRVQYKEKQKGTAIMIKHTTTKTI